MARLFPAEKPKAGVKGSFLYRLFRSEFLKSYPKPLSSDAFSFWGQAEPQNNRDAEEATNVMATETIELLISTQELLGEGGWLKDVKDILHKYGINMRYSYLVLCKTPYSEVKKRLACEILARSFRGILDNAMRSLHRASTRKDYHNLIAQHINLLFMKEDSTSVAFWNTTLKQDVERRFLFTVENNLNIDYLWEYVSNLENN